MSTTTSDEGLYVIQISELSPFASLAGQCLAGPRTPVQVSRFGYGFTQDKTEAWPFASHAEAVAKARIVCRHMSWNPECLRIEPKGAA